MIDVTKQRLAELLQKTGPIAPQGLAEYVADLEATQSELLPKDRLQYVLDWNHVPAEQQDLLFAALEAANAVPELVALSQIMAKDAVRALQRCTANEFFQPKPACLTGFARDAFGFLFAQLCALEGRKALRERGVPEKYDMDIPERMTRKQLQKFVGTGDINYDDYPWDINFYCCGIFLLDRFYFIPYRWPDTPEAWRNRNTGAVRAVWKADVRVRQDGQLDGVNRVFDEQAFLTTYDETPEAVTANPVSPAGIVLKDTVTLRKSEWHQVLKEGDYLLALHIPSGNGYTPERVKNSCTLALAFYREYFPEYHYVGFWSESWLYDPGLAKVLGPERNISRVQRQFYCYPTMAGDDMARREVLHDPQGDFTQVKPKTTLEKGLFSAWARGERFHTTGMFVLSEEVPAIGSDPYWKE